MLALIVKQAGVPQVRGRDTRQDADYHWTRFNEGPTTLETRVAGEFKFRLVLNTCTATVPVIFTNVNIQIFLIRRSIYDLLIV
jgi:hypothetical protein